MAMKQCAAGLHFYNVDVYDECPGCQESDRTSAVNQNSDDTGGQNMEYKTQPIKPNNDRTQPVEPKINTDKTQKIDPQPDNRGPAPEVNTRPKTELIIGKGAGMPVRTEENLPVSGWLVIIDGPGKGRDYRLIQGENKIGRDTAMEVCLDFGKDSDGSVSRDSHAVVVYDNNSNEFFVERGSSRNLPTVNGKTVRRDQDLQPGDQIQLGNTTLMFVPLCGESFKWS